LESECFAASRFSTSDNSINYALSLPFVNIVGRKCREEMCTRLRYTDSMMVASGKEIPSIVVAGLCRTYIPHILPVLSGTFSQG